MLRRILHTAMEEERDGKTYKEVEREYYAKLTDLTQLEKANRTEHQHQYEIKVAKTDTNQSGGRIRIRKVIPNIVDVEQLAYEQTSKIDAGHDEVDETTIVASHDMFKQFMLMAGKGMRKDRYVFTLPGGNQEFHLDCFYKPGAAVGSKDYFEWVKIDFEMKGTPVETPPFPFTVTEAIMGQKGNRTMDEEMTIRKLYEEFFLS